MLMLPIFAFANWGAFIEGAVTEKQCADVAKGMSREIVRICEVQIARHEGRYFSFVLKSQVSLVYRADDPKKIDVLGSYPSTRYHLVRVGYIMGGILQVARWAKEDQGQAVLTEDLATHAIRSFSGRIGYLGPFYSEAFK